MFWKVCNRRTKRTRTKMHIRYLSLLLFNRHSSYYFDCNNFLGVSTYDRFDKVRFMLEVESGIFFPRCLRIRRILSEGEFFLWNWWLLILRRKTVDSYNNNINKLSFVNLSLCSQILSKHAANQWSLSGRVSEKQRWPGEWWSHSDIVKTFVSFSPHASPSLWTDGPLNAAWRAR